MSVQQDLKEVPAGKSYTVEGDAVGGFLDNVLPMAIAELHAGALGTPDQVMAEIDAILAAIREMWSQEPDIVMRDVAAYSARITELEVHLHRVESRKREYKQIRTLQCGPALEELDRQFKIASRLIEVRRQDIDLTR